MSEKTNENLEENIEEQENIQQNETNQEEMKEEIDWKDKYVRLLAENENIKKRAEKAKQDASLYSIAKFAKEMLSIQDILSKAIQSLKEKEINEELNPFVEGIKLTRSQLLQSFEKFDIKEINPLGEKFDANFHEILCEIKDPEKEDMTIAEVFEVGYVIKDRLLRAAKVVVARK